MDKLNCNFKALVLENYLINSFDNVEKNSSRIKKKLNKSLKC